ncbi:hypothetical protein JOC86_000844 [Bacillus pakistanensis]|uniref:Uncharacterized protein n=1 Tax=Rossellomorea pakistanensis TaxID=992288 RepID=A0ABS2N8X7_9BACI|nr:hypothetical protein [Bacillus pakistanensis]
MNGRRILDIKEIKGGKGYDAERSAFKSIIGNREGT